MIESRIHIIFLFLIIAYASQSYPYLYTPQMSLSILSPPTAKMRLRYTIHPLFRAKKMPPDWNRTVNKRELHPCALSPRVTLTHRHTKMLPCAGMRKCLLTYTNLQAPFSSVLSFSSSPVWWFWLGQNRRKSLAFIQVLFF
jgi:hypothetical protein